MKEFEKDQLDTLIYGCTHYPFIRSIIESVLPPTVLHVDPAQAICKEVGELLKKNELACHSESSHLDDQLAFFCSYDRERFCEKVRHFMEIQNPNIYEENIHPVVQLVIGG